MNNICHEKNIIVAIYKFVELLDFKELRKPILDNCIKFRIKGTILLAKEGINGTIAGKREDIDAFFGYLRRDSRFNNIEYKESTDYSIPFYRMKVKLKKEIVTMGCEGINPSCFSGKYIEPKDWNTLISNPEVTLVDTRNYYEYNIGTFKGAINPNTKNFRDFPSFVKKHLSIKTNKKIAMFCTGGIRCEKSTSYLLQQGFKEVYHLKGGILKYLEEVPKSQSLWQGECFVFDNRVAVDHDLKIGSYDQCHGCRHPITKEDKKSKYFKKGISCHLCYDQLTDDQKLRFSERQKQMDLAANRNYVHMGSSPPKRQLKSSKSL